MQFARKSYSFRKALAIFILVRTSLIVVIHKVMLTSVRCWRGSRCETTLMQAPGRLID